MSHQTRSWKPLTIITKCSILDVAVVLDPSLVIRLTLVWNVSTLPLVNNERIIRIRVRNHILLVTDFLCSFPEVLSLKHFLYLRILVISYKDWPVLIQFVAIAYRSCFWQNFTNWMYLGNRKLWNGVISQKLSRCCCWWLQKHLAVAKFS